MKLPVSSLFSSGLPGSAVSAPLAGIWQHLSLMQDPQAAQRRYVPHMLRRLLAHATEHSPRWQQRSDRSWTRLDQFPVTSRAWVRDQAEHEGALHARDEWGEAIRSQTSGSSGQPLRFWTCATAALVNQFLYSAQSLYLERDLSRQKTVVSTKEVAKTAHEHWPELLGRLFATGPARIVEWRGQTIASLAEQLGGEDWGYLACPGSVAAGLCDYYETRQIPHPRAIEFITRSNAVSPQLRQRVRRLFGARVSDTYSCEELGPIAFECAHSEGHYHVALSNVIVEVVDGNGRHCAPGQPGCVLLTGLNNLATPFIRYDIGDIAALSPACPCGWAGPTLTHLHGREVSLLKLPNGERIYFLLYATEWLPIAPILEYRLTQDRIDHLRVELVAAERLSDTQRSAIVELVQSRSSTDCAVTIEQVDAIDWGTGHKRNEVVCLV
jgi:phenylacetate-CoA ligase